VREKTGPFIGHAALACFPSGHGRTQALFMSLSLDMFLEDVALRERDDCIVAELPPYLRFHKATSRFPVTFLAERANYPYRAKKALDSQIEKGEEP
jgi:hypothetical protein